MRHNHGHAAHLLTNLITFPQTNTHFVTLELLSIIVKLTGYSKTQRSVQLRAARTQNKNAELGTALSKPIPRQKTQSISKMKTLS